MDNLKAIEKFLKTYNLLRLNQEKTNNLNRLITSSETEFVIMKEKLITNRSLGLDEFTWEIYKFIEKKLIPTALKLFQKIKEGRTPPNAFYKAIVTLIPKPDKDITQKKKITGQYL